MSLTIGAAGIGCIVAVIFDLPLSQPLTLCVTQYSCMPSVLVVGVGAVALPVPPVSAVYQSKFEPWAAKTSATSF